MSWNITIIGKRNAVKANITANQTLPEPVKTLILSCLGEEQTKYKLNGVKIKGGGHQNSNDISAQSYIAELSIFPVDIIEEDSPTGNPPV